MKKSEVVMIDKLGKRAYVLPFGALILISLVLGTIFYPMTHAQMHDVPLGVLVLDEGVQSPAGSVNAGEEIAKKLADAPVSLDIQSYSNEKEADTALEDNDVYGVLIVPQGFTAAQAARMQGAQAGGTTNTGVETEAPQLTLKVNVGKNQMLATQLSSLVPAMMSQAGVDVQVEQVNTGQVSGGGLIAAMGITQIVVMPLFLMSVMGSILIFFVTRRSGNENLDEYGMPEKIDIAPSPLAQIGIQLALIAVLSALVAGLNMAIVAWFGGISVPGAPLFFYEWIVVACLMLAFVGAFSTSRVLGVLVFLASFAFGMMTAMLPREMLPSFWADWVCPWVPQYNIAEGVRSIVYFDSSVMANNVSVLLGWGIVGLLFFAISFAVQLRERRFVTIR